MVQQWSTVISLLNLTPVMDVSKLVQWLTCKVIKSVFTLGQIRNVAVGISYRFHDHRPLWAEVLAEGTLSSRSMIGLWFQLTITWLETITLPYSVPLILNT